MPTSSTTGTFSGTGNGNTSISLGMASQTVGAIAYSSTPAAYTLGVLSSGDAFSIATAGTSATGAISVTSTVTTAQIINAVVSFSVTAPFITNSGPASSSLNFNGSITLPSGTTSLYASGASAASSSTTIVNGLISGSGPLTIPGDGSSTGGIGAASTITAGTYEPTAQNTYTGGTSLTGQYTIIPITISSVGSVGSVMSGPFGTGTLTFNNGTNQRLRPTGGNFTILNAVNMSASGMAMESSTTNDTGSLTYAGPVTAGAHFISNGFQTSEGLATPLYGASMIFGLAATPSTITLPASGTVNVVAITGPVIINDAITGSVATVQYNSQAGDSYSVRVNGASTYTGPTTIGGANFANMGAILIGASSVASPASGPFGTGAVTINNNTSAPLLVPVGANQTVANTITMTSSFAIANGWYNTVDIRGTITPTLNTDPTGSHNLTLSGPITLGTTSRTLYNVMSSGTLLNLGSAASPSTLSLGSTLVIQSLPGYPTGTTVINDAVSGAGGLTVQNSAVVQLTNANSYGGTTTVTATAGSAGGTLLVNNTTASGTGSGAVNVNGTGTLGSGGTLGGTGTLAGGLVTISSGTPASQGGIVYPGPGNVAATLNVPSMSWQPLGRYVFVHSATSASVGGGVNGEISGTGTLDLSNLTAGTPFDLNLLPYNFAATPTPQTYTIANFSGGITGAGNVSGAPFTTGMDISALFTLSGTFTSAPTPYAMVVAGTGGASAQAIQLTFTPVPEPTFILAACGGLAALASWRRTRRRSRIERQIRGGPC